MSTGYDLCPEKWQHIIDQCDSDYINGSVYIDGSVSFWHYSPKIISGFDKCTIQ